MSDEAACADRLDLVDAAYAKPGGPEAQELKQHYCPRAAPSWRSASSQG